jgi:methionyl-tRNA formyltransferase
MMVSGTDQTHSGPRVVFCGTPEFAVPTLVRLIDSPFRPVLVLTQPDRKRGRGQKVVPSPVKQVAETAGLELYQPEKFNTDETLHRLRDCGADLAVVVAYSAKIGKRALALLPAGWLNLHPSLLPAYRGAAPMQWALIEGETRTGVTTFFLNEEWDAGPICFQEELEIRPEEDYPRLSVRCAERGADLVLRSVEAIARGQAPCLPQEDSKATFAPLLKPSDSELDWNWPAEKIRNRIRGLSPKPGVKTSYQGQELHLLEANVLHEETEDGIPGMIVAGTDVGFKIVTGKGILEVVALKPRNKNLMSGRDFLNGNRIETGALLSSTLGDHSSEAVRKEGLP